MKTFRLSRLLTGAVLAGTAFLVHAQDIKIGFNSDLSASPSAIVGQSALAAMQAAVEDINKSGGVLGRKMTIVVRDDLAQPPKAIQNLIELVDNEKVAAVFGAANSGNVLAWKDLANQKKMPVIVPLATATDVTKAPPGGAPNFVFRVSLVDRDNVAGLLAYVSKNPASKKVAYMAETTGYGQGALKDMQELGPMYGIKPVAIEKFGVGDTDMTSQLNKLKAAGADTVVIWAQTLPLAQILRSMEKINYFPLAMTSWITDQQAVAQAAGPVLVEKPLFMRTRIGGDMPPEMAKLFARIKTQTSLGEPIIAQASHAYDSVQLLALAIKQAGSTDGDKIREALEDLKTPYKGLMKTYDHPFSKTNREALSPADYHWIKWKAGKTVQYSDSVTRSLTASDFKR
ncbi:MAG: ABC transporter substrate-binding protein [Pseudomonadota bacterium]